MRKIYFIIISLIGVNDIFGQYSLSSTTYSQNFDGLGTATSANVTGGNLNNVNANLNGWFFSESGTGANTTITAGTGSSSTGDSYNFGAAAGADRTLGGLQSGSLVSVFGFYFINNTGSTITSLAISYTGETWRVATVSRSDRIDFQYSTDAGSLTTGIWTDANALDYANPGQATGNGSLQHSSTISNTITGLAIANGSGLFIRWTDFNASGSDDGMGINDFSFTATLSGGATGAATIVAGGTPAPATISSLINAQGAALVNFSFTVNEDGGSDDVNPTLINQVIINQGPGNHGYLSDWTQAISGASLSDGTTTVTGTVNPANITFASLANAVPADIGYIADNGTKTYLLKIWLKTTLGGNLPTHIHGKQFDFLVQTSGITTAVSGSSAIASGQTINSGIDKNIVWVVATELDFIQQPTATGINAAMSPAVTVSADDANGNRDTVFGGQIRITSTGSLSGSPVDVSALYGLASFSTLTHTAEGTGLTLNAERTATLDWDVISNPFNIQTSSGLTDHFRSAGTGDWNAVSTWESSPDNITWIAATLVPNENANTITIRGGHTVTISTAITADQVVIQNGAILINTAGVFTINDGTSDDIIVNNGGVFTVAAAGSPVFNTGATANINGGGILRVSRTGYTGNGAGANSANYIYQNASILEYTPGSVFPASGVTYFPNVNANTIPVFRITSNVANVGGTNPIVINGIFEANGNITFQSSATKTFRNGIKGSGNITQDATSGEFIISGTNAEIGGSGILALNTAGARIASTSSTILSTGKTINGGTLTIDGSIESAFNQFSQVTGTGSILINGSAEVESLNGLNGMFGNTGTLALGPASTIEYKSTAGAQTINGRSDYHNVIISGTSSKITSGNSIINGVLTLTNTIVTTSPGNLVTLTANASVSGGSSASYIDGPMVRQTNSISAYTFPVGRGGGGYKPFDVIPATTDASSFSGEYFNTAGPVAAVCNPARLNAYTSNEYWNVQRTSGIAGAQLRLNYSQAASTGNWFDGTGSAANPDATKAITIAHYNGTCWQDENLGAGILPGNASSGQVTSKVLSGFSPFTFGFGPLTVLPVSFGTIKATQQSNNIKIEWNNLTENSVINYSVERSADGRIFTSIGQTNARLNDGNKAEYSFTDASPLTGINFYRIRLLETAGSKFSNIVKLDLRAGATQLVLYPNPVSNYQISYQANNLPKGQYTIQIFNSLGQQVYSKALDHPGGSVAGSIILPMVKTGLYHLRLSSNNINLFRSFIVE